MISNNASYSNEFSTILRVTHHAVSELKLDAEDNGSDPLVKDLAEARFCPRSTACDRSGVEGNERLVAYMQITPHIITSQALDLAAQQAASHSASRIR